MMKTKIVLDADVIIHFYKGGCLTLLPKIFPTYQYIVLSHVYQEIKGELKNQLSNQIYLLKDIQLVEFAPRGDMLREYALLQNKNLGKGESACMAYCKYNHDVLGSSNLTDITDYCQANDIVYLTTIDFLYFAIKKNLMSIDEAHTFVKQVQDKDSHLPTIDFNTFVCDKLI